VTSAAAAEAPERDPHEPRIARGAAGLLGAFNAAGVLDAADVHVAVRLGRLGGGGDERVLLAAALTVRGIRMGSVCVELAALSRTVLGERDELVDVSALPWPEPEAWRVACAASPLVAAGAAAQGGRPLRLVGGLLYLERYWLQEEQVRHELGRRAAATPPAVDVARLRAGLERLFGPVDPVRPDRQRLAAAVAALRHVTVVAGGPGTGKTTTVARLLALLAEQGVRDGRPGPRIAMAAPTGKAAARLAEAVREELATLPAPDRARVGEPPSSTLHRLLGWRPGSRSRFRHDRSSRLPFDVIVVDETSMVSLTLMARLLEAVPADARLVLVGDPDQLASVEAGAVLGDLTRAAGVPDPALDAALSALDLPVGEVVHGVVTLDRTYRFRGAIADLARAVQAGDAEAALAVLRGGGPQVLFVETADGQPEAGTRADVLAGGRALDAAARRGDVEGALAALEAHRVLCGHRRGPFGVVWWAGEIDRWLSETLGSDGQAGPWYPGRPVLVTANDYETGLYNGDTGVVVQTERGLQVAFARGGPPALVAPARLAEVQTVHATTVHRAQGSQLERVTVVLPPAGSPLLSRELLYTAVTRARSQVRVLGSEAAVRAAVERPVSRASGLRERLGAV
jgi:exodeoxyribonuclease V alpha subunit